VGLALQIAPAAAVPAGVDVFGPSGAGGFTRACGFDKF